MREVEAVRRPRRESAEPLETAIFERTSDGKRAWRRRRIVARTTKIETRRKKTTFFELSLNKNKARTSLGY